MWREHERSTLCGAILPSASRRQQTQSGAAALVLITRDWLRETDSSAAEQEGNGSVKAHFISEGLIMASRGG